MAEFLENGLERIFQGSISEGIQQLISVLAESEAQTRPSADALEIAARAETELVKLGAAIAMESDSIWVDGKGNQIKGSSLEKDFNPSIILTIKGDTGRSLISNAPVSFDFVKGSGTLTSLVNTDTFGQASCAIAKFDNPQAENVIRAALTYRVLGLIYRFENVFVDFVYVPPARKATLLVMERSTLGVATNPFILDPVFQTLKGLEFDFNVYNASISPDTFMRVFQGDNDAITEISLDEGVSYLVVILNDTYSIRQLELRGQKYDIYVSDARASTRIIRSEDGKIMFQSDVERAQAQGTHGQGGTQEKAVVDVQRKISEDMAEQLAANMEEIKLALTGTTE
jgi:hypothetical protein